jgi:hypothetical protein
VSTAGCDAISAAWVWPFCSLLLLAFGKMPVMAAVAARLATMTAPAAVAISGCRRCFCGVV